MGAMCIATPPPLRKNPPVANGGWQWLSARPDRLLGLAALLQTMPLGYKADWLLLALLPISTLSLGVAMQVMPRRLHSLPIAYAQRVLVFATLLTGGLLVAPGDGIATLAGTLLLTGGWLPAWRTLRWKLHWATGRVSTSLRLGLHGLELLALSLLLLLASRF